MKRFFSSSDWLLKFLSRIDRMIKTHTHTQLIPKQQLSFIEISTPLSFISTQKKKTHTNPVVSCSLFVGRWDTYQQDSFNFKKANLFGKKLFRFFSYFPRVSWEPNKKKKVYRHKCIHIQSKTTKRIKFLNILILHFQFKPETKPNQIQFEISSDCQFKLKKEEEEDLPWFRARCLEIHRPIGLSKSSVIVYQNLLELIQRTININK